MTPYDQNVSYFMSALCTSGGLVGYIRRKSIVSLVAGTGFGASYFYSGYLLGTGNKREGLKAGLITSSILLFGVLPRAILKKSKVSILLSTAAISAGALHLKSLKS